MRGSSQQHLFGVLCLLLTWQVGCAAFHPVNGIPAHYLPVEMRTGNRSQQRTIDLSLLRQPPPPAYLVDAGDVLGVYVEGFVGKSTDPPPVFFPQNADSPPSFGLPYPVRDDGTISLPGVGSVKVRGMTLPQAEERVRQAYLSPRELINPNPDKQRVQVNLQRPRQYRVLVIRQDSRNEPPANGMIGQVNLGLSKRGSGKLVNLPAYSNDVLNALSATDGLPGLDAEPAVYVIRRRGNSVGPLDPRWSTDIDPALLMRLKTDAASSAPVIRGQSYDAPPNYQPSWNPQSAQANTWGTPQQGAVNAGNPRVTQPYERRFSPKPSQVDEMQGEQIAPPRIWSDRTVGGDPTSTSLSPYDPSGHSPGPVNPMGNVAPVQYSSGYHQTISPDPNSVPPRPTPLGSVPPAAMPSGPAGPPNLGRDASNTTGGIPGASMYGSQSTGLQTGPQQFGPGTPVWNGPPVDGPAPYGHVMEQSPENDQTLRGTAKEYGAELNPGLGVLAGPGLEDRHVIRIPVRLGPGETADIRPEDVILYDGDIVFIESRDTEVFYTAGLLGGGQYTLPRDYDLDILQAISLAQSRNMSAGVSRSIGGTSALNSDVSISPSTAIVLRKLPDGGEVPIKVDLYRARTDLSERIVIRPGDYILLQYTKLEAIAAFFERHLLETALFGLAAQQFNKTSTN
jgi:Polysaccharide biosynthesis/export protein